MLYLLDANVLIDANRDYYPIERVPEFWDWLLHVCRRQQAKVPQEIYEEVAKGNDGLTEWSKANKDTLVLDESVQAELVRRVVNKGYAPDLDDSEIMKLGSDPFLIAYALADTKRRCIVTTEVSKPSMQRANRHIPDVCGNLNVHCCDTFTFTRQLNFTTGWRG